MLELVGLLSSWLPRPEPDVPVERVLSERLLSRWSPWLDDDELEFDDAPMPESRDELDDDPLIPESRDDFGEPEEPDELDELEDPLMPESCWSPCELERPASWERLSRFVLELVLRFRSAMVPSNRCRGNLAAIADRRSSASGCVHDGFA